ncbi:type VII secretion integral membrane protein EccD [Mycobacterium spongiae]|uniref:Type VII secretion integral membrane protein EccD n=1 Tax=Mycobacterium spongiae TaxID=886343 RepID=A0A975K278_9MYCO|nr:type VII secretion integral membrane protein EccD [Mycobacterium spongiae]
MHAGAAVVDLSLPAGVPVASLIPSIVDSFGSSADLEPAPYNLTCPSGTALDTSTTLAQNGIRDGAVLVLSHDRPEPPTVRYDDVAEAVAETLRANVAPRCGYATRLTGALAANGVAIVGALALIRNTLNTNVTRYGGATVATAAASSLVALLLAVIAHRTYRDPIAGLTLSVLATSFAAVAGLLAVPGGPGVPNVLLAAMSAAVASVLALRATGCGVVTLTATACAALVIAVATLSAAITSIRWPVVGSLTAVVSLGLLEASPRMAIVLAGLSPHRAPAPGHFDADPAPATTALATRAIRADQWLTSLLAAFSSSAAIAATSAAAATRGTDAQRLGGVLLVALTGVLLLLRARRDVDPTKALMFTLGGIITGTTALALTATALPEHGPWIVAATAMLAAAAAYLSLVAPTRSLSPVIRRRLEQLECLALIAMAPLTCWICDIFSTVRGLDLA